MMSGVGGPPLATVSALIHSSDFYDQTDDAEKDEDNVSWAMRLPAKVRDEWLTILQWIRAPDRLLEHELFCSDASAPAYGFDDFRSDWLRLRAGEALGPSPFQDLFDRLADRWSTDGLTEHELQSWDLYLESLWRYREPDLATIDEYREALYGLSASFFLAFPFQPKGFETEVGALGVLDQFFNNLRDLHEDTLRGVCYFPADLLRQFGIERQEIPSLLDDPDARFIRMYEHLLATFVPELRQQASRLLSAPDLHDSWVEMLRSVLMRHSRIEYVARLARFNPKDFRWLYWPLVQRDFLYDESPRR